MTDVLPHPPLTLVTGQPKCHHRTTIVVDDDARTLTCKECGAVLDPIQVFKQYALRLRNLDYSPENRAMLIWEKERISREVEELQREKRRLQSWLSSKKREIRKDLRYDPPVVILVAEAEAKAADA